MLAAWELRARRNALHYIADFRESWDDNLDEFFLTGRDDVEKFLRPTNWGDTRDKSLLEIGCGVGRMTRHFAPRFARVVGVDISPTMIRRALKLHRGFTGIEFYTNSGSDLSRFDDNEFDYVISYIVFQHIPDPTIIYGYVREALRVLKPAGRLRFQARNDHAHPVPGTYNGASIDVQRVAAIASECGRKLLSVEGIGTAECFIEIG